ncbi:MAG: FIST N-terminal domain-containing protein, partial [Kiloniellales bacterium]|nr:FIST N-terminal domain-containing protein [Kiloniellales bacterium]
MEQGSVSAGRFKAVYAAGEGSGDGWAQVAGACADALGDLPEDTNLGFLYATDVLADDLGSILELLRSRTGITDWVGTIGMGVLGTGVEFYNRPAISLLVGSFDDGVYRLFSPIVDSLERFRSEHSAWIAEHQPILGVVHGDPRNHDLVEVIEDVSEETSAFLVGGLTSSRGEGPQISRDISEGGLSGVLFASDQLAVAALTQGCTPIG